MRPSTSSGRKGLSLGLRPPGGGVGHNEWGVCHHPYVLGESCSGLMDKEQSSPKSFIVFLGEHQNC